MEYIEIFFRYLVKSTGHLSQEDYKKALELLPEGGEKIMETLADQWMEQGRREEREELLLEKPKWERQAELKNSLETLIDVAAEQYGPLPGFLHEKIKSIQSLENLRALTRKVIKTQTLKEFTDLVNQAAQQ
ncbi:MAG: hypothetical protein U5L00_02635 [Desulfovermiculus sp.]|nr:hypothetical protein [Desulfovermiculus sp.]